MNKDAFLGRPPDTQFQPTPDFISIMTINGRWWKEQRRFSMHVLRNLGFGKTKMEEHIKDEISVILDHLTKLNGSACDVREILVPSMSNNISALVFGQRFDYDDPKRKYLNERLEEFNKYFRQFSLNTFFPWMKPLLPILKPRNFEKFRETLMKLRSFISNEIKCHEESLDQNCIRDYIDSFLIEMKDRQKENNVSSFTYSMLTGNVQALFGAGSGTVRTTIEWCLLTMAAYSDVQKLVQKEIDSVIGSERSPSWADHKNLPYTKAVIFEVQRWQTITPLNLLRYTTEDTSVQGYNIPKGTFVLTNIWAVHHDHRYWKNPDTFFPEHFFSQDGTTLEKPECFIPFSIGKRSCPGETLGLIEVFLYFTSILQRFTVALPDGEKPTFDGTFELAWEAKFHHFRLLPRN